MADPSLLYMLAAYHANQAAWAWDTYWAYAGDKLAWNIQIAAASAVVAGTAAWFMSGTRIALISGLVGSIGGPVIVLFFGLAFNLVRYPAVHESELYKRIAVLLPTSPELPKLHYLDADKQLLGKAVTELSEMLNNDGDPIDLLINQLNVEWRNQSMYKAGGYAPDYLELNRLIVGSMMPTILELNQAHDLFRGWLKQTRDRINSLRDVLVN
jgi:hypothetical protein